MAGCVISQRDAAAAPAMLRLEMVYLENGLASSQKVLASMVTKTDGAIQSWKDPLWSVALALQRSDSNHAQDALRVLNIVLRQQQAKRGCLLVRQSFFSDIDSNLVDLTGGVIGCRGLHSSFRTTKGGLSLNMDVSTTMVVTPGPVVDFLLANQNVRDIRDVDWPKARKMLKNLRVKAKHINEFKIIGLSDQPCSKQRFPMEVWNGHCEGQTVDITVKVYFKSKQALLAMPFLPCLDVGKLKRPNYLPIEVGGSRYWPLISRNRASVCTQFSEVEMIDSLFKPLDDGKDDGIIRELVQDFYQTSEQRKPSQTIISRSGGEFPRIEKGSIPWDLKSPNLSEDKNAMEVPDFNPSCSQHPWTFETRKAPEVMNAQPKNDIKAHADSSEILEGDLVASKLKPGIMPSYFSARCCGMFMLVACLFIGSTSVAIAENHQVQCSVTSVATNIRHFCAVHQPTSLCCDAIRGAVLTYEGISCLCLVGESPDIISMGFTASDLLRINSLCGGRDFSSGDYPCAQPNDDEMERDNELTQYNESAHTVGLPHTAEAEKARVDQPYVNREDQDHYSHPSSSVIAILISLVILLIGLLVAATLLIHRRQQLRIGDMVHMARAIVPPVVAAAGPAAVAALPVELRAAAAAALPPEGE